MEEFVQLSLKKYDELKKYEYKYERDSDKLISAMAEAKNTIYELSRTLLHEVLITAGFEKMPIFDEDKARNLMCLSPSKFISLCGIDDEMLDKWLEEEYNEAIEG